MTASSLKEAFTCYNNRQERSKHNAMTEQPYQHNKKQNETNQAKRKAVCKEFKFLLPFGAMDKHILAIFQ